MERPITLKQSLEIMKRIKEHDYNDELNVYVKNGHWVIEEKLIRLQEVKNGK